MINDSIDDDDDDDDDDDLGIRDTIYRNLTTN